MIYRILANALRIPEDQVKEDMERVDFNHKGDTMTCFTFEFGEPDSFIYHIPEGSVSHVTILSRGITGNIHLKTGEVISKVPRLTCESLVAWMCGGTPAPSLDGE